MTEPEVVPAEAAARIAELEARLADAERENARLANDLQDLNCEVIEALERQTAMSEVLNVIAKSPTDPTSVLRDLAGHATRLLGGEGAIIAWVLSEDERYQVLFNPPPGSTATDGRLRPDPEQSQRIERLRTSQAASAVATREGRPAQFLGTLDELRGVGVASDDRPGDTVLSVLAVPLKKGGEVIGSITVQSRVPEPFDDTQVATLETFADQAVIAIENARLFNELQGRNREVTEALEQQTAIAGVLRAISSAPDDPRAVLQGIHDVARTLLDSDRAVILEQTDSGVGLAIGDWGVRRDYVPPGRTFTRAALEEHRVIHVSGPIAEWADEYPGAAINNAAYDAIATLAAPVLWEGEPLGVIQVLRNEARAYTDGDIRLIETLADQAAIALHNARLFNELQDRNREVTEALDRQTATSDVLSIISRSPYDTQPVFDAVVESAARLCNAEHCVLYGIDGDHSTLAAQFALEEARMKYPIGTTVPLEGRVVQQAVDDRKTVHLLLTMDGLTARFPQAAANMDFREHERVTILQIPLFRDEAVVGVLQMHRFNGVPFSDSEIALVQTFADQSEIAIENARLFNELQDRNREVTEALDQQTATGDVLNIISRSATDAQPVLDAIAERAARLSDAQGAQIQLVEGDQSWVVARSAANLPEEELRAVGFKAPITGLLIEETVQSRATVHFWGGPAAWEERFPSSPSLYTNRDYCWVSVPLFKEDAVAGCLQVFRYEARPFTESQLRLIELFADQASIAMENARIFTELQDRNREVTEALDQQTAMAEVLEIISKSATDAQPVLDALAERAARLSAAEGSLIHLVNGGESTIVARYVTAASAQLILDQGYTAPIAGRVVGVTVERRSRVHVWGRLEDFHEFPGSVALYPGVETMCWLSVPLFRDDEVIGCLQVSKPEPVPFADNHIALLEAFADQAVIAMENARLFNEIQEKSRELEIASKHKSEFMANMSHELRTPLNAIIGYAELLQEECADLGDEAYLPDLAKIQSAARHLLTLINDILDLSRVEAGRMTLYLEDFDINALIDEVTAIVSPLMDKNGNNFVVDCPEGMGAMRADMTKVRQALFNILSNAAKFTEQGTVTLRVARPAIPADDESVPTVEFVVADTGIGMSEEAIGRIFAAFSQADASITLKYGGTGLGLAISREFCRLMGGDITVVSAEGEGSTFTVTLPAQVGEVEPVDTASVAGHVVTVLVIDDDPAARDLLRRTLEKEGYGVILAAGGEEGLRIARLQPPPAAITLDVIMPGMDGWQVLAALKADAATADIPVIVLTMLDDTNLGFTLGATGFMTKPVDRERLSALLRQHTSQSTAPVLLVDDDRAVREMVRRQLQAAGWTVEEAENGRVALEKIAACRPALILLDLVMPVLDGFGVVEELQAHEEWRDIPVVVVTGKDMTLAEREGLDGAVQRIIQKGSVTREALLAGVREMVARATHAEPHHAQESSE